MIIWLSSTLPLDSYYVDGFQTGDDYSYKLGNRLAQTSNTDDDTYFTHTGNNVKQSLLPVLNNGTFTPIKTNNPKIFAYTFEYNKKRVLTIGNLDFENPIKTTVKIPKYNPRFNILPIKISNMPDIKKSKVSLTLQPGEIVVLIVHELL